MSDTGLVSVIIPNFNCARWLPQVIEGCIAQGASLREVIVVDDGSTDDSVAVLERLSAGIGGGVLRIFRNPDKGANAARNYGFAQASGAYIQWLDADDFILPGKLERQLAVFRSNPSAHVVYSDWYEDIYVPGAWEPKRIAHKKAAYADFTREILADNWSVPANYLFRRELAERLDERRAWNPSRLVAQDREYVTLAALSGAAFVYTDGFFSVYNRWNPNSVSSMPFSKRLEHQLDLEETFREEIRCGHFSRNLKRQYEAILNAHVINACYYNPGLTIKRAFLPTSIDFRIVHYKKYPFIPFIYAKQLMRYAAASASQKRSAGLHLD